MPVPDSQSMLLPLLRFADDGTSPPPQPTVEMQLTVALQERLATILNRIESLYGPIDPQFLNPSLTLIHQGHIWDYNPSNLPPLIRLSADTSNLSSLDFLVRQLAHECVHTLSSEAWCNKFPPTYLDEGLATYFAHHYYGAGLPDGIGNYTEALTLVADLLRCSPDAIRILRGSQNISLSRITASHIRKQFPNFDSAKADRLAEPFRYS